MLLYFLVGYPHYIRYIYDNNDQPLYMSVFVFILVCVCVDFAFIYTYLFVLVC